jgi:hypothetical protein
MNHTGSDEVLVILSDHEVARVRSQIEQETRVLHSVSPRVFVVEMTAPAMDYLAQMEDEVASTISDVSPAVLDTLNDQERQWVSAWNLRRLKKPRRLGEGLPWDAPGFSPPDRQDSDDVTKQDEENKEQ